ncbi:MAG: hypothetical protein HC888_03100 [Candidatus Competibacteraceae bacterium]|nr:hypothetical protein [Candidatus Competibacteraceae bacterium]
MMLFFAQVKVEISCYMVDEDEHVEEWTHLVEAADEDEARRKVRKFYEAKSSEYSVYYSVQNIDISETIV